VTPRAMRGVLALVVLIGGMSLASGIPRHPIESWSIYLVNFLFWSGLSAAGVAFAALLELTDARWARSIRPIAQRFAFFLPVSLLLFLLLLAGVRVLFPWATQPPASHTRWFTVTALAARDAVALLLLTSASFWFIRRSAAAHDNASESIASVTPAAVSVLIVYAASFSILAVDLVMSMEPGWTSTLFPAYVFTGSLYGAIAAVSVAAAVHPDSAAGTPLDSATAHDLGKLLLGFSLLWLYLHWAQFLTIWYGNLPREFEFLTSRVRGGWNAAAWIVFTLTFAAPFVLLLARRGRQPRPVAIAALLCLAGIWLERLVLVAGGHPFSLAAVWIGVSVTAAFAALFVLSQTFGRAPAELTGGI
jgi:hypothetical protein